MLNGIFLIRRRTGHSESDLQLHSDHQFHNEFLTGWLFWQQRHRCNDDDHCDLQLYQWQLHHGPHQFNPFETRGYSPLRFLFLLRLVMFIHSNIFGVFLVQKIKNFSLQYFVWLLFYQGLFVVETLGLTLGWFLRKISW